jgi:hypothetical protein
VCSGRTIEQAIAMASPWTSPLMMIHNLYARYVFGIDTPDPDLLEACLHPDAVYEVAGGYSVTGRGEILEKIRQRSRPGFVHHVTNLLFDSRSDTELNGRASFTITAPDGMLDAFGEYEDLLRWRQDGGWRFAHRIVHYTWRRGIAGAV